MASWWLIANARSRLPQTPAFAGARPALLCGAIFLGIIWLQLLPLPLDLLRVISPQAAHWHEAAAWPAAAGSAPITVDQYGTLQGALKSTAYMVFFALTLLLLDRRARIAAAAYTLVISGFVQAVVGGVWALTGEPGTPAHGGFVNRNHFAGYMELCLSMGLGLLLASLTGEVSHTWKQFVRNVAAWILSPKMRLRLALVVMVTALVLSRSRMGNTAFFVSMLITGGISLSLSKYATRSMVYLLVSLVLIDIIIVGTYFGVEQVVERIEKTQIDAERNEAVLAVGVWRDYPVFGAGLGSFQVVFPRYKDGDLYAGTFEHAHNDYVEFAGETGIIGLSLLGLMVLLSFLVALRAHQVRRDPLMRGLSFGSMMAIIALMIHSFVDFNLQIPANALTFMLMLAFGWISLYHQDRVEEAEEPAENQ